MEELVRDMWLISHSEHLPVEWCATAPHGQFAQLVGDLPEKLHRSEFAGRNTLIPGAVRARWQIIVGESGDAQRISRALFSTT